MSLPQGPIITRNRERLSCKECRRRKLKCNRALPCSCCLRRGDEASCTYQRLANTPEYGQEQRTQVEARLQHLEMLVQRLASQSGASSSFGLSSKSSLTLSAQGEPLTTSRAEGACKIRSNDGSSPELSYNGSTHWSAMLNEIQQLRLAIPMDTASISDDYASDASQDAGVSLIFGGGGAIPAPLEDILARYLPPRQETDRLISAYFRAGAVAAPFIHGSQFRKLYAEFWRSPTDAPPLWISLLFSICHIAVNTLRLGNENKQTSKPFSVAAAQCIALGQYFRPKRFAVESVLLFAQAQCLTSPEISQDIGSMCGILIRLATSMGYHREPDNFRLSPFEKEMRRRTWSFCMQLDLIVSFHLGLPSGAQYSSWDVAAPRNLLDSDFDEASLELPLPRPDSETTHMVFYIAKHRLMAVFDKILRHTLAATRDDSEAMVLDAEMRDVFAALPHTLHSRPMAESVVDPANLMVTRLCVSFLYHKCLCVLHRPYVTQSRAESIRVCYESASSLIKEFVDAYHEFLPGGQMETEAWFMSSITWHDYLFGVVALCMVVCATSESATDLEIDVQVTLRLLGRAQNLCLDQDLQKNKDIARVSRLIDAVILRFGVQQSGSSLPAAAWLPDAGMLTQTQDVRSMNTEAPWVYPEMLVGLNVDSSWEYLEQFVDFTNQDLMPES